MQIPSYRRVMTTAGETGGVEGLPPLRSRYALTPEQIERFRADGHLLLRGVCSSSEVAAFGDAITAAVSAAAAPGRGAAPGSVPPSPRLANHNADACPQRALTVHPGAGPTPREPRRRAHHRART